MASGDVTFKARARGGPAAAEAKGASMAAAVARAKAAAAGKLVAREVAEADVEAAAAEPRAVEWAVAVRGLGS